MRIGKREGKNGDCRAQYKTDKLNSFISLSICSVEESLTALLFIVLLLLALQKLKEINTVYIDHFIFFFRCFTWTSMFFLQVLISAKQKMKS